MLSLAVWIWRREPRILLRRVASLALAAVVLQALLGGLTVLMRLPVPVSVAHAGLAQVFFCLSVVLAVCTGRAWMHSAARATDSSRPPLKLLAWVSTGLIFGQLLLGAVMRHTGAGLAIPDFPLSFGRLLPPEWTLPIAIHFAHRVGALVVSAGVLWTVSQVERCHADCPELVRPARLLGGLLVLQVCLGALTIWTARMALPTTLHVSVGAVLLATSLLIGLRAGRLLSCQRVSRMGAALAEGGVA
jgi:cytochrome c oxidase assembly protein subunit 15